MKRTICAAMSALAGTVLLLPAAGLAANVCSEGVGIPPFLSSGAKPNLLMVLDNSGSMLDAAYSKAGAFCFDDTFDAAKFYGGSYQNDKWYQWSTANPTGANGPYPPWEKGKAYSVGDRVYANGIIWEVEAGGAGTSGCATSAACDSIDEDENVSWAKIFSIPKWKNAKAYTIGDIVWSGPQLFKATSTATSNDPSATNGLKLEDDTGVTWTAIDSTWMPGKAYAAKSIVTYKGILYETVSGGTSTVSATGLDKDTGVTWKRLDEGSFKETDENSARTFCSGATGTKHSHAQLCLTIDTSKTPNQVNAFAAKGSMLNWLTASKFDVEKKILTGGKHDYYDKFLINEHRGCSGSRLVKQLQLSPVAPATVGKFLSLGMRSAKHSDAPHYEDRIDSTDDTGRLEVLAVTDEAYKMDPKCAEAINTIITHGLNGAQNDIDQCIATFDAPSGSIAANTRPTLNNSLQVCWQDNPTTSAFEITNGLWNSLIGDCKTLYTGTKQPGTNFTPSRAFIPSELRPPDGGPYLCYGVYDQNLDHQNRVGYMGRCWNSAGSGGMATCSPWKTTSCAETPKCLNCTSCEWKYDSGGNPVTDTSNNEYFRNDAGGNIYYCDSTGNQCADNSNNWKQMYKSSAGTVHVGDDTCGSTPGGTTGSDWEVTTWPNDPDSPAAPGNCILEAIKDYCDALKVPEVIDPSSSAGKSGETGNAPALLRDSELMAFLGGKDPMATMKGRIQQADRPKGIVHNVAQDLRLGVMSFRYVGAKSECDMTSTTSKLEKYCPQNNKDGAQLLTPLEVGDYVKATNDTTYPANGNKRRHVDELAEAINSIRGTSWTPLAEALYSAVGYYSQNANFCLNKDSSNNCLDFPVCKNFDSTARKCLDVPKVSDPVQYWCQDNHIIVITEGESTADANVAVKNFTATPSTHFIEKLDTDNVAGDGDNAGMQYCVNGGITGTPGDLYSSAYLDNMTWWGQHVKPLYRTRYVKDPDGNLVEKQTIYTHMVTTGALTSGGAGECNPATLMTQAAMNGGTGKAPDYYYPGENPQQLEDNLYAVLDDILSRSSAGSAASVISSSRSGSGAVYQAVFWPKHEDPTKENKVSWIGDVHALLVSSDGLMYEDSDQNGKLIPDEDVNRNGTLDTGEDKNGNGTLDTGTGTDRRVIFYFSNKVNRTRGCYTTLVQATADDGSVIFQCPDDATYVETECPGNANGCVEIQDIKYLWSATKQLGKLAYGDTGSKFLKNRKIFTWNDANNNGMVDTAQGEWFSLSDMDLSKWKSLNTLATNSGTRGPVTRDFIAPDEWSNFITQTNDSTKTVAENAEINETNALNALTGWILGTDQLNDETTTDSNGNGRLDKKLRPRMFKFKGETMAKEWRLGDIIHSTPIAVSNPAESYHLIYRDPTYASFAARWKKRRTVVYFGGNDGLLHATNGGFYSETGNQFCCTAELDTNGNCVDSPIDGCGGTHPVLGKAAQLGDELWSYLPYNLQPHMKCLADRFYAHKYYVDQKPRIFDAQIFTEEAACKGAAPNGLTSEGCIHPGGWGTILVGSMRFGGSKIAATNLNGNTADKREFTSSFFILDITNPEAEPKLLGELTRTKETDSAGDKYVDLNYTTSSPTMIIMRTGPANQAASKWYLVMGNGPAEQDGSNASTKQALLGILPLEWLQGGLDFSGGGGRPSQNYNTSISPKREIRLENKMPGQSGYSLEGGRFLVPYNNGMPGFISDMISVDYNIDDSNVNDQLGVRYRTDAIYFGTVDGAAFEDYHASHPNYLPDAEAQFYWNGGGRLFRMVTKEGAIDGNGEFQETNSIPSQWKTRWPASGETESVGPVRLLADLKMPMVAGPSIGYDGYNYWIYAGTGRFFSDYDKTDDGWCLDGSLDCAKRSKISFFGIKEPLKDTHPLSSFADAGWYPANDDKVTCKNPVMTWGKIHWNINQDVTGGAKNNNLLRPDNQPGKRGLMQTDDILAISTDETNPYRAYDNNGKLLPYLACYEQCSTYPYCQAVACVSNPGNSNPCENPSLKCFPGADTATNKMQGITPAQKIGIREPGKDVSNNAKEYYTFQRLKEYIAGRCDFDGSISGVGRTTGIDGWYRDFHDARERNLGTSALLGGLLTFTTYQPFNDKCKAEGESSLYGIHFQTGTPWVKSVFGTFTIDSAGKRVLYKKTGGTYVMEKLSLGRGLSTTPSLHVGTGAQAAKAFVQTSTGEIIEVDQQELPITNQKSGRQNWTDRCGSND